MPGRVLQRGHRYYLQYRIDSHTHNDGNMMFGVAMDVPDKVTLLQTQSLGASPQNGGFGYLAYSSSYVLYGDGRGYRSTPEYKMTAPWEGRLVGVLLDLDPASPRHLTLSLFLNTPTPADPAPPLTFRGVMVDNLPLTCDYRAAVSLRYAGDKVSVQGWADGDIPVTTPPP